MDRCRNVEAVLVVTAAVRMAAPPAAEAVFEPNCFPKKEKQSITKKTTGVL